ncbi:MAG: hypothetical protein KJ626_07320 [Verrucomicrobia bacterium]|nr:hypothetical protein [Verrucomicrobiota bacterium]
MNEQKKPDVEAIVEEIRKSVSDAEASIPVDFREGVRAENDLHENLAAANRACAAGQKVPAGALGLLTKLVYRLIRPLTGEINEFHAGVVRVLNKLVRILEGGDAPESSELLEKTQRRISMLAQLSERLGEYDDMNIEERLRRIEEKLDQAGESEDK